MRPTEDLRGRSRWGRRRRQPGALAVACLVLLPALAAAEAAVFLDPEGQPLPFGGVEEALEFLREAEPVSWGEMEEGTNRRKRSVVLERNGRRARAIFRFGYEVADTATGGFVDSYRSELAAFELSRLLGLDAVPPVVPRKLMGKHGALQIWIEQAMTNADRIRDRVELEDPEDFEQQMHIMRVFDLLIHNIDRNPGNILIDRTGKVWFIDQTRSFSGSNRLRSTDELERCERELWRRLRGLPDHEIASRLRRYSGRFTGAVLARRKLLVEEIGRLLAEEGEERVLFTRARP